MSDRLGKDKRPQTDLILVLKEIYFINKFLEIGHFIGPCFSTRLVEVMTCVHRFIRDVSNPDQQDIMAFSARGLYSVMWPIVQCCHFQAVSVRDS
jgi:hypothetical protein